MTTIKACILDFDGVILESNEAKDAAFKRAFAEFSEYESEMWCYHLEHRSLPRRKKFEHLVATLMDRPGDDAFIDRLVATFSELAIECVTRSPAVPGALEFLEEFSSRIPLYISSVTPHDELQKILTARNLNSYFVYAFGNPPHPKVEAMQTVLEREALRASEVVVVGDSQSDLDAARVCNLDFIGRDSGQGFEDDSVAVHTDLFGVSDELRPRIGVPCR